MANIGYQNIVSFAGFLIPVHDTQEFNRTDGDLSSIVFKKDGIVVATLTFNRVGGELTSIVRT